MAFLPLAYCYDVLLYQGTDVDGYAGKKAGFWVTRRGK